MWLQRSFPDFPPESLDAPCGVSERTIPQKALPKTRLERYGYAMGRLKKLADVLAETGGKSFGSRCQVIEDLFKKWAEGKEVIVVEKGTSVVYPNSFSKYSIRMNIDHKI